MIDLPLLLTFLVAASILTITPGVDTAMVLRSATVDGRRAAVLAAAGICTGCLVWGAAVAFGLGALLHASAVAYTVVKLAGAIYLVWLGCGLLARPRAAREPTAVNAAPRIAQVAFRRGLLTNLLNPKIGVFYVTFLPQFVPAVANVAEVTLLLVVVHVALSIAWFALLIAATVPLVRMLDQPGAVRTLDRLTGLVFVGFGVKLATSSAR